MTAFDHYYQLFRNLDTGLVAQIWKDATGGSAAERLARVAAERLFAEEFGENWRDDDLPEYVKSSGK